MTLESRIFTGGMDSDTEHRLVVEGDYLYALNMRLGVTEEQSAGSGENVKGNTKVDYTLPNGFNKCIGSFDDKINKRVIAFIWNFGLRHRIMQYDYVNSIATTILETHHLGFDDEFLITGISLEEDILLWTDDNQEPSMLNIKRAMDGGYPSNFVRQYLDLIKYPPDCQPGVAYGTDNTIKANSLRGTLWQFKYVYLYADDMPSVGSPISKVAIPSGEEADFTGNEYPIYKNNFININLWTADWYVRKIEIHARNGNLGDFLLVKTLDKDIDGINDYTSFNYKFYNNQTPTPIDLTVSNSLYDRVPLKARSGTLIDGNMWAMGDILENYDLPTPDLSANAVETAFQSTSTGISFTLQTSSSTNFIFIFSGTPIVGNILKVTFKITNVTTLEVRGITGSYSIQSGDTLDDVIDGLSLDINSQPYVLAFNSPVNRMQAGVTNAANTAGWYISTQPFTILEIPVNVTISGFKTGATHPLGIVYRDKGGRMTTVLETDESVFFAPFYPEQISRGPIDADFFIYHTPPEWATYYNIVYAGNQTISSFLQFLAGPVSALGDDKYKISIVPILTYANDNENSIVSYGYNKGDRMRLIRNSAGTIYPETVDVEIIGFDTNNVALTVKSTSGVPITGMLYEIYTPKKTAEEKLYYEMGECYQIGNAGLNSRYHKGKNQDQIIGATLSDVPIQGVFESSDSDVEFDGKLIIEVLGAIFNQVTLGSYITLDLTGYVGTFRVIKKTAGDLLWLNVDVTTLPTLFSNTADIQIRTGARTRLNEGDVYYKARTMNSGSTIRTYIIEAFNYSDFYSSATYNKGRPNKVDLSYEEVRRPAYIYYSEKFIPGTNINGLGQIFGTNFEEYDQKYGGIRKLFSQDKRLECYQELKVGAIFVNQTLFTDANGVDTVSTSTKVLNQIKYYKGEYGIGDHPESFSEYGGNKWFADPNRGVVCRNGADGVTPISEYNEHNFFTDIFGRENDLLNFRKILGVYDKRFDEYVLSIEISKVISGTIATSAPAFGTPGGITQTITVSDDDIKCIPNDGSSIQFTFNGKEYTTTIREINGSVITLTTDVAGIASGPVTVVGSEVKTIGFSEVKNKWTAHYSYAPDMMVSMLTDILTFKDGAPHTHNTNSIYNNFYGVQYKSQLQLVVNGDPDNKKVYNAIFVKSNSKWYAPLITNEAGQKSSLIKADFDIIEDEYYAAFWKDENSGVDNPLIQGDDLRDSALVITLENDDITFVKIFSVAVKSQMSQLSNK